VFAKDPQVALLGNRLFGRLRDIVRKSLSASQVLNTHIPDTFPQALKPQVEVIITGFFSQPLQERDQGGRPLPGNLAVIERDVHGLLLDFVQIDHDDINLFHSVRLQDLVPLMAGHNPHVPFINDQQIHIPELLQAVLKPRIGRLGYFPGVVRCRF